MSSLKDIHAEASGGQPPAMELLEGVSSDSQPRSRADRLLRGSVYGVILTIAATLLAVTVVPETSAFVPFVPEPGRPKLDPEFLAELIARQEAYLRSQCVAECPYKPSVDETAANGGTSVTPVGDDGAFGVITSGPDSERTVPSAAFDDGASAVLRTAEGAALPAD